MFSHVSKGRGKDTVGRAAAAVLLAAFAAGCSADVSRFASGPIYAGSTPNQRALLTGDASADDQIVTGSLPGTPPANAALQQQSVLGTGQVTSGPAITYKGWSSAGGTPIVVQYGDTVDSLSTRYNVPADAIRATNRITPGTPLAPGTQLVIPTYSTNAPAVQQASVPAAAAAASKPGTYKVQPGDTAWSIARAHNITPSELLAANGLSTDSTIQVGRTLKIPGGTSAAAGAVAAAPKPTTLDDQKAALDSKSATAAQPTKEVQVAALPSETKKAGAAVTQTDANNGASSATEAPPTSDGADGFRWPARGRIISGFGKQADGANNDGINLAVPAGTPVKAAEKGTVIYAGNELQGYGNLILIQHKDGWVSAYAHNEALLVKRGETVQRGQVIAKAGATGSVSQPQLHFELRKGSQPVDPLPHLSGA